MCQLGCYAVPTDHRVKLKERDKIDKNLDMDQWDEKLWNMMMIPIIIGA